MSIAAKTVISTLKNIPGINIAASILNAAIAGCIIVALGDNVKPKDIAKAIIKIFSKNKN